MNIWWDQFQEGQITVPYGVIKAWGINLATNIWLDFLEVVPYQGLIFCLCH